MFESLAMVDFEHNVLLDTFFSLHVPGLLLFYSHGQIDLRIVFSNALLVLIFKIVDCAAGSYTNNRSKKLLNDVVRLL